jgi:acetylornithine/succinyldiaminopimelate/putrescine aminotransferase
VSLEFFDILEEIMPAMANVAAYFRVKLDELAHKNTVVKEVRSIGMMFGMELTHPGKQLVLDAMAEGLLINCTHDNVLRFLPPYVITEKQVDQAISVLSKILKKWKPE